MARKTGEPERRSSMMFSAKDDLLMSLLASEAMVDSRGFDILSAEEVEELKKVRLPTMMSVERKYDGHPLP